MLIWDEISMTGQALFCKAYKKMKRFLCTSEDEEPRVHLITAGDFTQLPPCFEKFIFEAPQFASEHFEPKIRYRVQNE